MTDGPFKNLKLDSFAKRFVEAVQNDAESHSIRCAFASNAILRGLLNENELVIRALQNCGESKQLTLDDEGMVKSIFESNQKSEFADHLSREINFRLYKGEVLADAIKNGLQLALEVGICGFRTRVQEACLESHREGDVPRYQLDRVIDGSNQVLKDINRPRILSALRDGNKDEFKQDIRKRSNIDDGPTYRLSP